MLNQLMDLLYRDLAQKGTDVGFSITTLRELYYNLIYARDVLNADDKERLSKIHCYISLLQLSEAVVENQQQKVTQKATIIEVPNVSMLVLSIPYLFNNYTNLPSNSKQISDQIEHLARIKKPSAKDLQTLLQLTIDQVLFFFEQNEDLRFKLLSILSAKNISNAKQLTCLLDQKITYSIQEIAQTWHMNTHTILQWSRQLNFTANKEQDKLNASEFITLYFACQQNSVSVSNN